MSILSDLVRKLPRSECPGEGIGHAHQAHAKPIELVLEFRSYTGLHADTHAVVYGSNGTYPTLGSRPDGRKV